jgi:hypothetical protein
MHNAKEGQEEFTKTQKLNNPNQSIWWAISSNLFTFFVILHYHVIPVGSSSSIQDW